MTGVEFEVRDSGATELGQTLGELAQSLTIGVHEDAVPYEDGTPVATVGAAHEFGSGVPTRSFLRGWVDSGGTRVIGDAGQDAIGDAVDGAAPDLITERIGDATVSGVVARMDAGIRGDGGEEARDLQDSGRLRDSIEWQEST